MTNSFMISHTPYGASAMGGKLLYILIDRIYTLINGFHMPGDLLGFAHRERVSSGYDEVAGISIDAILPFIAV